VSALAFAALRNFKQDFKRPSDLRRRLAVVQGTWGDACSHVQRRQTLL